MSFSQDLIDKIYNYKTISNRIKIDRLLEIDVIQYTNLGLDSTKKEKDIVKKNSKYIYKTIKKIDESTGNLLLEHQDK
jgi:hypothetical protein|tara:strand:+ start:669 stop:902 length:234 start_codon:yes stop_codon:yes gene_type:complete